MNQKSKLPIVRFYWNHRSIRFDDLSIFTQENDHNPFVAEKCPKCSGMGKICEHYVQADGEVYSHDQCDRCKGTGHIDKPVRLFDNERVPIVVHPKADGWLICPFCGWIFTI